ncbi:hypothetical protein H920_19860 [Fukomys damarensis]|uniref:Uncharacterized protein n=1 Tax=Fukomys damarensis TaxID=885580 RepID=A0A091CJF1_FUKDA|nr:hypothetical protein H920_19860 [Fukomys damarensis]
MRCTNSAPGRGADFPDPPRTLSGEQERVDTASPTQWSPSDLRHGASTCFGFPVGTRGPDIKELPMSPQSHIRQAGTPLTRYYPRYFVSMVAF